MALGGSRRACQKRDTLCDDNAMNGCEEEDDEWSTGTGFKCMRNGKICKIPQQLLYDGVRDCEQGEDICFDDTNLHLEGHLT